MPSNVLVLNNNSLSHPQSIDITPYIDLSDGKGADPAAPAYTNRVWSRSLLKAGATLSYEQLTERELTFPLHLGPVGGAPGAPTTLSQTLQLVQQINQILETPGATAVWQPPGVSQPTTFDILSGILEIAYSWWQENQHWTSGNLRIFTKPLGRTAGPRRYATASGVGPLLMISPYASAGAPAIGASTQAGVSGFGGQQEGASSGVFYWGSPSLAGDAPAQLQISYVGPLPNGASNFGTVPYALVSVLPDSLYRPLITANEITAGPGGVSNKRSQSTAVAGAYHSVFDNGQLLGFPPIPAAYASQPEPTVAWAGQHRLLAIARASAAPGYLYTFPNPLIGGASVTVNVGDWQLYDLGTFALRASEPPSQAIQIGVDAPSTPALSTVDVTAFIMLPDNATWYLNPTMLPASQYGYPAGTTFTAPAPYTNTFLLDDVIGDQFLYQGASQSFAPSPIGSIPSAARITPYSRGLVPQPDPKNGLPVLAIVGVGQPNGAQVAFGIPGASWANPQNLRTMAQVNVLEQTRYVLP